MMIIIDNGYTYEVSNFSNPNTSGQTIQFVQSAPINSDPTHFEIIKDGTTNEELLRVLIHRLLFLQTKVASEDNNLAIIKLKGALIDLERRAKDREQRGVIGTQAI